MNYEDFSRLKMMSGNLTVCVLNRITFETVFKFLCFKNKP